MKSKANRKNPRVIGSEVLLHAAWGFS